MMENDDKKLVYMSKLDFSEPVKVYREIALDMVWLSEKCWFLPGDAVLLVDDAGNMKIFVK